MVQKLKLVSVIPALIVCLAVSLQYALVLKIVQHLTILMELRQAVIKEQAKCPNDRELFKIASKHILENIASELDYSFDITENPDSLVLEACDGSEETHLWLTINFVEFKKIEVFDDGDKWDIPL